jgi:UDP-N-acetylglucosamine--N-acetylmuramyl-(pentapeptide) pyrophosphoryl-undecaprenol N-acetylglucosamine transferase
MRVLVATGASGGHIFPAVAFIEALQETDPGSVVKLVLPERRVNASLGGIEAEYLGIPPFRARPARALIFSLYRLAAGTFAGLRTVLAFRPDVVVGFGSLPSVPVVFLAWMLRIKTVVHEQNAVPGKANLFLSRFVDRVAVSFEGSRTLFPAPDRTVLTGNPLRKQVRSIPRAEACAALGLSAARFTVLVTGGSQGSAHINRCFLEAIRSFPRRTELQVIHITGQPQYEEIAAAYAGSGICAKVFPFFERMELAYSCADIAVCRAGAMTCAELMFYALPALIIPYPLAQGHQAANAEVLEKNGSAVVISDRDIDAGKIRDFCSRCMLEPLVLSRMSHAYPAVERDTAALGLVAACREVLG